MNVISRKTIIDFWKKHPDAEISLSTWFKLIYKNNYSNLTELQKVFSDVELVGNRYVFNIRGNNYRLICRITFPKTVFIRAILTHKEYDRYCKTGKIGEL